jgi:hypothetical protein
MFCNSTCLAGKMWEKNLWRLEWKKLVTIVLVKKVTFLVNLIFVVTRSVNNIKNVTILIVRCVISASTILFVKKDFCSSFFL